jgi:hypothetical protein
MKNEIKYGVFYVNEIAKEKVAFRHAFPVEFNREQAEKFIKDINFDRWYRGGSYGWTMQALPIENP